MQGKPFKVSEIVERATALSGRVRHDAHRSPPSGRGSLARHITLTRKDFVSNQEVKWCPGCGDYAILAQVQKVLPEIGVPRENIVFVSGSAAPAASRTT